MLSKATIPEVDADSVKRMIDSSRQSKDSTVFDISFSNVKNNGSIDSAPGELGELGDTAQSCFRTLHTKSQQSCRA